MVFSVHCQYTPDPADSIVHMVGGLVGAAGVPKTHSASQELDP